MVNLSAKAFKAPDKNKSLHFQGALETDAVSVSIVKQNIDTRYRQRNNVEAKPDQSGVMEGSNSKVTKDKVKRTNNITSKKNQSPIVKWKKMNSLILRT